MRSIFFACKCGIRANSDELIKCPDCGMTNKQSTFADDLIDAGAGIAKGVAGLFYSPSIGTQWEARCPTCLDGERVFKTPGECQTCKKQRKFDEKCPVCHGERRLFQRIESNGRAIEKYVECTKCEGHGTVASWKRTVITPAKDKSDALEGAIGWAGKPFVEVACSVCKVKRTAYFDHMCSDCRLMDNARTKLAADMKAHEEKKAASNARLLVGECLWQGRKIGICTEFHIECEPIKIRECGEIGPRAIFTQKQIWIDLLHDPRDVVELYRVNAMDGLLEIYNRKMDGKSIDPLRARLIPTQIVERMNREKPPGEWRLYFEEA